jgi:hypothetical protein
MARNDETGVPEFLIPFHVDRSWYERYWWHDSAPRKPGIFAFFRRILSISWFLSLFGIVSRVSCSTPRSFVSITRHVMRKERVLPGTLPLFPAAVARRGLP